MTPDKVFVLSLGFQSAHLVLIVVSLRRMVNRTIRHLSILPHLLFDLIETLLEVNHLLR